MSEEVQKQEAPVADQADAQVAQQPAGPDLNVSDLVALKSIIEIATQRGAFKAAELEAVGKTFNKLNAFLEAVAKKEA
jgi:uncharacterized phage protein gp47/JayE